MTSGAERCNTRHNTPINSSSTRTGLSCVQNIELYGSETTEPAVTVPAQAKYTNQLCKYHSSQLGCLEERSTSVQYLRKPCRCQSDSAPQRWNTRHSTRVNSLISFHAGLRGNHQKDRNTQNPWSARRSDCDSSDKLESLEIFSPKIKDPAPQLSSLSVFRGILHAVTVADTASKTERGSPK